MTTTTGRTGRTGSMPGTPTSTAGDGPEGVRFDEPSEWAPALERLLGDQLGLYERLNDLSQEQSRAVESGQSDALLSILGRRDGVLRDIQSLNAELQPFTQRWDALSAQLDERRRSALRLQLDALDGLVRVIAERDESDRVKLEERRGAVARELGKVSSGRAAAAAYGRPAGGGHAVSARFQDREG